MHRFLLCLWAVVASSLAMPAVAQPVMLTEGDFAAQTAGLPRVIENFNGFSYGLQPSPMSIANGVYVGNPFTSPAPWCFSGSCLSVGLDSSVGTFQDFPAGTTYWSARVYPVAGSQTIVINVSGRGGVEQFISPPTEFTLVGRFVGFHDPRGLLQVSFSQTVNTTNYSLDDVNVAIAGLPPQPVPSLSLSGGLLLAGLVLCLGWIVSRSH